MLRPDRGAQPTVEPGADVDASAQDGGDVTVGPDSSIWMNVVDDAASNVRDAREYR